MIKKLFITILLVLLVAGHCDLNASTSQEVFDNGKRALDLGKFPESEEIFSGFIAGWPDHKLTGQAKFYRLLAKARQIESSIAKSASLLHAEMAEELARLEKDFSAKDLAEIKTAIEFARSHTEPQGWEELARFSDADLKQALTWKWHGSPTANPVQTLKFANDRLANFKNDSDPHLIAQINYLKALALWQIYLSPLSLEANAGILKTWNDWPVHNALEKAIRIGFNLGNRDIKKNVALLGFHYDCFRQRSSAVSSGLKSRWLTYLSERGINLQEAWCPR